MCDILFAHGSRAQAFCCSSGHGDRIALLDAGELQQLASPQELVENPANKFVDQFLGQHRFQLSLLTQTVRSISIEAVRPGEEPRSRPAEYVSLRTSLVEALDIFKKTGKSILPVYKQRKYIGDLYKKELLQVITKLLGETDEGGAT